MSDKQIPELSAAARNIVSVGSEVDGPSSADRERVRAAVMAAVSGTAVAGATATAEAATAGGTAAVGSASGMGIAAKLTIAVALVVGGGTGVYLAKKSSEGNSETVATQTAAPQSATAAPATATATETESATETAAATETAPAAATETGAVRAVAKTKPTQATQPNASKSKPSAKVDGSSELEMEQDLLDLATSALRSGNPARALEVVNESRAMFPKARFTQERAAIRILALCALDRTAEAEKAVAQFRKNYPSSPHIARIDRACAGL